LLEPTNGQLGSSAVIDGVGNMASAVDLSAQQVNFSSERYYSMNYITLEWSNITATNV
jgi:hypothetical protein